MRVLLWLLPFCAMLSACNLAWSERPMFSDAQRSMKTFKAGLWVGQDPVCSFDSALPKERWPKCASWFLVDANSIAAGKDAEPKDMPIPLLLAEGQPPIVQVLGKADENKPAYFFLALRAEDVAQPQ